MRTQLALATLVISLSSSSFAQTPEPVWKVETSFSVAVSKKASIKLLAPKGMKIQFAENGVQKEDTIPYVLQVPNDDAFIPVTFIGEGSDKFSEKIEVKHGQASEVKVLYTPAPKIVLHKGKVAVKGCPAELAWRIVMTGKPNLKKEIRLKSGQGAEIELPAGVYEAAFFAPQNGKEMRMGVSDVKLAANGFALDYQCRPGTSAAIVLNSVVLPPKKVTTP